VALFAFASSGTPAFPGAMAQEVDEDGADVDTDADMAEDADVDAASGEAPPAEGRNDPGMPREVFERLLSMASETCRTELQNLAETQGKTQMSEECNREAGANMQTLRNEASAGRQQQQQQGGAPPKPAAGPKDGTNEVMILLAVAGAVVVGLGGFMYSGLQRIKADEAKNAGTLAKERRAKEKREKKRMRKGKPVQPTVPLA